MVNGREREKKKEEEKRQEQLEQPPRTIVDEKGRPTLIREKGGSKFLLPPEETEGLRKQGSLSVPEETALQARTEKEQLRTRDDIVSAEAERSGVTGQLAEIQQQAAERAAQTQELINLQSQDETLTRLQQAGLITVADTANLLLTLGAGTEEGSGFTAEGLKKVPGLKIVAPLAGKAVQAIPFLKDLYGYDARSANIRNLKSDAGKLRESTAEVLGRVAQGYDVNLALIEVTKKREAVEKRYNDAMVELRKNPTEIANGLDLSDSMAADLARIDARITLLQQYAVTRDRAIIMTALQSQPFEEKITQAS